MHKGKPCTLTGSTQTAGEHYVALVNIINQAQSLGLDMDEQISRMQDESLSESVPIAALDELIKQTRRKLYLQMMEFEMLNSDLAELHSELLEAADKPRPKSVELTLV